MRCTPAPVSRCRKPLLDRLLATRTFNQGFATVEYTACALVDLDLHSLPDAGSARRYGRSNVRTCERIAHAAGDRDAASPAAFSASVLGRGYAAGYYSYMWSEVLDADAFAALRGEPATPSIRRLPSGCGTMFIVPETGVIRRHAYKAFRGRLPTVDALSEETGSCQRSRRERSGTE